jgi:hypothetical protein
MTSSEEEEGVWTFDVVYKSGIAVKKHLLFFKIKILRFV